MRRNKCSRHSAKIFALLMSAVLTVGTVMPVNAAEKKEKKAHSDYLQNTRPSSGKNGKRRRTAG